MLIVGARLHVAVSELVIMYTIQFFVTLSTVFCIVSSFNSISKVSTLYLLFPSVLPSVSSVHPVGRRVD